LDMYKELLARDEELIVRHARLKKMYHRGDVNDHDALSESNTLKADHEELLVEHAAMEAEHQLIIADHERMMDKHVHPKAKKQKPPSVD